MSNLHFEVSIIIPTFNSAPQIAETCESLLKQKACSWEAIFVDAGSEDRTVAIIQSYQDSRFRIQTLTNGSIFALMNRGVLMAQGRYIHLLLEGCTYLAPISLTTALRQIADLGEPDLFYTASYVGDPWGQMHLYYLSQISPSLIAGLQPTLLQACFIKATVFKKIGYFHQDLQLRRGGLDFFCRFIRHPGMKVASDLRVYVEMALFPTKFLNTWIIIKETWQVIYTYFGIIGALRWLFSKKMRKLLRRRFLLDIVVAEYQ